MKFKEFSDWCNERACDGCWSSGTAIYCLELGRNIYKNPFWKREKEWKKVESEVIVSIVNPINEKIRLMKEGQFDEIPRPKEGGGFL